MRIASKICDSITDGQGFRMTVFFQGCPHHCVGCHNPESWGYEESKGFDVTIEEVLNEFDDDPILSGITLSGGEPFSERNLVEVLKLVQEIKKRGKNVWVYTGYTLEQLVENNKILEILKYVDVLVDGRYIEGKRSLELKFRGSTNQRLIDIPRFLQTGKVSEIEL